MKKRVTITLEFLSPQYKVLSVLPGSGMGISVATPSTQKVVKSSQIDLYCTFHNTQCFKAALQKNHDDNVYNILRSSCLTVAFSRLDLEDNIIYVLRLCKQSSSWDIGYYIVYIAPWVYCTYADKIKVKIHLVSFYSDITLCLVALINDWVKSDSESLHLVLTATGLWCHDTQRRGLWDDLYPVHEDHDHNQPWDVTHPLSFWRISHLEKDETSVSCLVNCNGP